MSQVFWGLVRTPADKRDMAAIAAAIAETARAWSMIEPLLAKHAYIAGDIFTLAGIPWGVHAHRWFGMDYLGLERPEFPAVRAWYGLLCERPACQEHVAGTPIS